MADPARQAEPEGARSAGSRSTAEGRVVALRTDGITPEIVVTESRHIPGAEVVEIPGLGYWASRESAQEALDKLARGMCPMSHEIEVGFAQQRCRICGELEHVADESDQADEERRQ